MPEGAASSGGAGSWAPGASPVPESAGPPSRGRAGRHQRRGGSGRGGHGAPTSRCGALVAEDQHRRVVQVTGAAGHPHHAVGERTGVEPDARGHQLRDPGQALLDRERGPLHDPVGQQHVRPRAGPAAAGDRVALAGDDAERQAAHVLGDAAPAAGGRPDGADVPGPRAVQLVGGRVEAEEGAGGEERAVHGDQQVVDAAQDLAGVADRTGHRPQRHPDLPHEGGRLHVVALHVPDGEAEGAVAELEAVVPVAADVEPVAGRRVPGGRAQPRDLRQAGGEHLPLQRLRQFHPRLLHLHALPGDRGEPSQPGQQGVRTLLARRALPVHRPLPGPSGRPGS
ncbi:hypothetical protein GA0115250_13895 [Streptomyces sp. BvitLS-983]|nr:hypothetical protein GA0115250_13895 [Streptomyces sp. BvitLS-983]